MPRAVERPGITGQWVSVTAQLIDSRASLLSGIISVSILCFGMHPDYDGYGYRLQLGGFLPVSL